MNYKSYHHNSIAIAVMAKIHTKSSAGKKNIRYASSENPDRFVSHISCDLSSEDKKQVEKYRLL